MIKLLETKIQEINLAAKGLDMPDGFLFSYKIILHRF